MEFLQTPHWCLTSVEVTVTTLGSEMLGICLWFTGFLKDAKHLTPRHLDPHGGFPFCGNGDENELPRRDSVGGSLRLLVLWMTHGPFFGHGKSGRVLYFQPLIIKLWEGEPDRNLDMGEISGNLRNPLDCIPPNFSRLWLKAPLQ